MFIPFDPEQMLTRFLFAAANVTARPWTTAKNEI